MDATRPTTLEEALQRIATLEAQLDAKDRIIDAQRLRIEQLEHQVDGLTLQATTLMAKLGQNSSNSHLPPSSDGPGARSGDASQGTGGHKDKRKHGGQPGHRGVKRELVPASQVDEFKDVFPPQCENCWRELPEIPDPQALRHQLCEIPPIKPHITEIRHHCVMCACGHKTRAKIDPATLRSPFGVRLMSIVALFTGVYHISRRQTVGVLRDILGVDISLGAVSAVENRVSEAIKPAADEALATAVTAPVKHADATSWLQRGKLRSLWTLATSSVTVFGIFANGTAESIKPWFGACKGILVTDRATVFSFWPMTRRQICWAHLLRKFVAFSERCGPTGKIGAELVEYAAIVFHYWRDYRAGSMTREQLQKWMEPVRARFEACLQVAAAADIKELSGSCADILDHKQALWTFLERNNVEPTNNHSEQELRGFVLWRKCCFGSQSDRGDRFAERIMTVAHTARKQNRNAFGFIVACCEAQRDGSTTPSLLAPQLAAA
jgi:transposase